MRYLYYPGCSLHSTGRAYEESFVAVMRALDVEMRELDDWNCCGATAYMAIDQGQAVALAARNLALAEQQSGDGAAPQLIAPCAACYLVLSKARHYLDEYSELGDRVRDGLRSAGLGYTGRAVVRHPLDVLISDVGLDVIRDRVRHPLAGLPVACYYGCQVVRPYATFDDQHNPMSMDRLLRAAGATTLDWPLKTRCCGGSLTGTIVDVGLRLNHIILREAQRRGAAAIATACPLCQFNLECLQDKIRARYADAAAVPTAYFTQLLGVALGLPGDVLGLKRLFVPLRLARASGAEASDVRP
jgi:heterodisulfide reductase subunit B